MSGAASQSPAPRVSLVDKDPSSDQQGHRCADVRCRRNGCQVVQVYTAGDIEIVAWQARGYAWFGVPMRVPPVLEQAANLTQTNPVFVRPCRTAPFGLQAEMRPAESSRHNAAKRNTRCMRTTRCILAQVEGKTVLGCDNHRRPLQPLVTSDRTPSTLQDWRLAQEYFKSGWRV